LLVYVVDLAIYDSGWVTPQHLLVVCAHLRGDTRKGSILGTQWDFKSIRCFHLDSDTRNMSVGRGHACWMGPARTSSPPPRERISFRKSSPSQNGLIFHYYQLKHEVDGFVGALAFQNLLINTLCQGACALDGPGPHKLTSPTGDALQVLTLPLLSKEGTH
jgi:hypothetical protein